MKKILSISFLVCVAIVPMHAMQEIKNNLLLGAVSANNLVWVKEALAEGADAGSIYDCRDCCKGKTALHEAVFRKNVDIVRALASSPNINVNATCDIIINNKGECKNVTPLHVAVLLLRKTEECECVLIDIISILLAKNANVCAKYLMRCKGGYMERTALHDAVEEDRLGVLYILLDAVDSSSPLFNEKISKLKNKIGSTILKNFFNS